jgi:hypothetical protein
MRKVLYVSPHRSQWRVHWQYEQNGEIFNLKTDAISRARKIVGQLTEGQVSQIRVQKADGAFQTEWTYGQDPYPPRG